VSETIFFANEGVLRGGFLAVRLREVLGRLGLWHRYVVRCKAEGKEPLLEPIVWTMTEEEIAMHAAHLGGSDALAHAG
jgi:hypothetical protein